SRTRLVARDRQAALGSGAVGCVSLSGRWGRQRDHAALQEPPGEARADPGPDRLARHDGARAGDRQQAALTRARYARGMSRIAFALVLVLATGTCKDEAPVEVG